MRGARPQLVLIRGGLEGFKVLANGNDTYYLDGTFSEGFAVIVR